MKMTICLRWKALVFQNPEYYPWSFIFNLGNHFPDWSNGMYEGIISVFSSSFKYGGGHKRRKSAEKGPFYPTFLNFEEAGGPEGIQFSNLIYFHSGFHFFYI